MENVTIPDSVTAIGERAFCLCTSLKSVSVSTDVTSIGKAAFGDCFSLTDVYYAGTKEQWDTIVIDSNNEPLTDANIHTQETRTVISIEIITPPNRLTYSVGDALDTTGLIVRANYSDDTSEELNVGFTLSGFDSSTAGSKAVTVTYQGKNAAFSVTVINPDAPRLTIENRTAFAGSSFTVPVLLTNNPGVIGFSFALEYDAEKLEYLGAADADFIGVADNISANDNQLGMVYFSASSENLTAEKVVNLTFRAKMGTGVKLILERYWERKRHRASESVSV